MSFPSTFPTQAVQTLLTSLMKKDFQGGPIALSVYDLVGFGLYQAFGDVKYLMTTDPSTMQKITEILATLPLDKAQAIFARATELKAAGKGYFIIFLTLLKEYGPIILQVIQAIMLIAAA